MIEQKEHFHGSDLEKIEKIYGIHKEDITSFSANVNPLGIDEPRWIDRCRRSRIDRRRGGHGPRHRFRVATKRRKRRPNRFARMSHAKNGDCR